MFAHHSVVLERKKTFTFTYILLCVLKTKFNDLTGKRMSKFDLISKHILFKF